MSKKSKKQANNKSKVSQEKENYSFKESPPSQFLNFEIAERTGQPLLRCISFLKKMKLIRSAEEEIEIEKRFVENTKDKSNLSFRGYLDGITHYLIWLMVFLMPIFIPYIKEQFNEVKAPGLLVSCLSYVFFISLAALFLTFIQRSTVKYNMSVLAKTMANLIATLVLVFFYFLLVNMGLLPALAIKTKIFIDHSPDSPIIPDEFRLQLWFATFSKGKYLLTYITTILTVTAFVFQQLLNRDRLTLRLPLRKTIFFFFFCHLTSLIYPYVYEESVTFDVLRRINQWIQYFLIFIVLVNSANSLGRLLSIAKASSLSGTVVALIGLAQYFWGQLGSYKLYQTSEKAYKFFDVFDSYVYMNKGKSPFSTFGQNNFSAAYVCLSIPITVSLIMTTIFQLLSKEKQERKALHFLFPLLWGLTLVLQCLYLTVSMGKAGIVSMVVAVAFTTIVGLFVFDTHYKKFMMKMMLGAGLAVILGFTGLFFFLSQSDTKSHQINQTISHWETKLSKTFDITEGSNRVRIFYVGSALRIMKKNMLSLITGVGADNFKYHYPVNRHPEESKIEKSKHVNQTHCEYAQFASDTGLPGFVVFSLLMIFPLVVGIRILLLEENLARRFMGLGFYCTLCAMAINSLFFFPFQTPGSLLPYFISLGLLFSMQRKDLSFSIDHKITLILVFFILLGFLSYEAWFSCHYYEAEASIWLVNMLLACLGLLLIYLARLACSKLFSKSHFLISVHNDILLSALFLIGYVALTYKVDLSFLYNDYLNYNVLRPTTATIRGHAKSLENEINRRAKMGQKLPKKDIKLFVNNEVYPQVARLVSTFEKARKINPYHPDIYNNFISGIDIYCSIAASQLRDEQHPFIKKYNTLKHLNKTNPMETFMEEWLTRIWPNNKDYSRNLTTYYYQLFLHMDENNPSFEEVANKVLKYGDLYLKINPSGHGDGQAAAVHTVGVLDAVAGVCNKLNKQQYLIDFYNKRIKNNWFVEHDISLALARIFNQMKDSQMELEARLHAFKVYPRNRSNRFWREFGFTRKYNSNNDLKKLDELLKAKLSKEGKILYPNGIASILHQKRHKKTVFEYLTQDIKGMEADDYTALRDILLENKAYDELKTIQDWQIKTNTSMINVAAERKIFETLNPDLNFDNYVLDILKSGYYKVRPQTLPRHKENCDFLIELMSKDESSETANLLEKLITNEILYKVGRRMKPKDLKNLQKSYNKLEKSINFKDFMSNLIASGTIHASSDTIIQLEKRVADLK